MARQALKVQLEVEYVSIPKDRVGPWRAGISLLLQLLKEELAICMAEVSHEAVVGAIRDDHRTGTSLFPLADIAQRKRTSTAGSIHAWVIGNDGSVHRMALADWRV